MILKKYSIVIQTYDDKWHYYGGTDKAGKMILLDSDYGAIRYQNDGLSYNMARKLKANKFPEQVKDFQVEC